MKKIDYNNIDYYFDDNISIYAFENIDLTLPMTAWKKFAKQLFGGLSLNSAKNILLRELDRFDKLNSVFKYNKVSFWLDKNQRTSILSIIDNASDTFDLIIGSEIVTMNSESAKRFINDLNIFAYKCLVEYIKYKQQINNLSEIKDIEFNYPEKLNLNDYID